MISKRILAVSFRSCIIFYPNDQKRTNLSLGDEFTEDMYFVNTNAIVSFIFNASTTILTHKRILFCVITIGNAILSESPKENIKTCLKIKKKYCRQQRHCCISFTKFLDSIVTLYGEENCFHSLKTWVEK